MGGQENGGARANRGTGEQRSGETEARVNGSAGEWGHG